MSDIPSNARTIKGVERIVGATPNYARLSGYEGGTLLGQGTHTIVSAATILGKTRDITNEQRGHLIAALTHANPCIGVTILFPAVGSEAVRAVSVERI